MTRNVSARKIFDYRGPCKSFDEQWAKRNFIVQRYLRLFDELSQTTRYRILLITSLISYFLLYLFDRIETKKRTAVYFLYLFDPTHYPSVYKLSWASIR